MSSPKSTAVVRGASLLIIIQIVSRGFTFAANQLLLRFLTAKLLGVSTQLEVYYLSVLFFARESLRVAVQRQDAPSHSDPPTEKQKSCGKGEPGREKAKETITAQSAVNIAYLSVLLGFPLTFVLGWMYLRALDPTTLLYTPNLIVSLYLYGASAVVELLSEPAFVVGQVRLRFAARGRAESMSTFVRCILTLGSAAWGAHTGKELGVLPFALGQIAHAVVLLGVYVLDALSVAREEGFSLLPKRLGTSGRQGSQYILGYFYQPTLHLASSMVVQSGVKYVLTQGDTLLVSILSTPEAVGVYALANNYGGLLARLVFQPVEESSRSYFSRLLVGTTTEDEPTTSEKKDTVEDDKKSDQKNETISPIRTSLTSLTTLLHLYLLFSLPIISLGPSAASPLLSIVAGQKWTAAGAGSALAAYCYYIPLLAINGITEAFVSSVASEAEVYAQSGAMFLFTGAFGVAGYVTLRVWDMGARGLVAANAVNMACRIVWSAWFVGRWFRKRGVETRMGDAMPAQLATAAAVVTAGFVSREVFDGEGAINSLAKVAGCAIPFGLILLYAERDFLMHCYKSYLRCK